MARISAVGVPTREETRRIGRLLMIGVPLFDCTMDFAILFVTYRVLASIAPDTVGEVGESPAVFAAGVVLVKLPMTLAYMWAVSRRDWPAFVTTGEYPRLPVRKGWRRALVRLSHQGISVAAGVVAALAVFHVVADLGDVPVWHLVAVTALVPLLLTRFLTGPFRLIRWCWRRRPAD